MRCVITIILNSIIVLCNSSVLHRCQTKLHSNDFFRIGKNFGSKIEGKSLSLLANYKICPLPSPLLTHFPHITVYITTVYMQILPTQANNHCWYELFICHFLTKMLKKEGQSLLNKMNQYSPLQCLRLNRQGGCYLTNCIVSQNISTVNMKNLLDYRFCQGCCPTQLDMLKT